MPASIPPEVRRAVKDGPVTGLVDTVERTPTGNRVALRRPSVRWDENEGLVLTDENQPGTPYEVPQQMVDNMQAGLPSEIRRTARERFGVLVRMLFTDAQQSFYRDGVIRWPASIQRELAIIGAAQGKPDVAKQVEALARRFVVKGAREQQAHDRRQITRSWHGHLSA